MSPLDRRPTATRSLLRPLLLALVLCSTSTALAQADPNQAATLLLDGARRAYNEKNYPFAAARFREFLMKHGGHKDAPAARYGLALCLIEGPERKYDEALQNLQPLAGSKDLPDYPNILYYLGHTQRMLGSADLAQIAAKPQEAAQLREKARVKFEDAGKQFEAAAKVFQERTPAPPADAKELPVGLEWAARARCDQAEMLIRQLKAKEAQAAAAPFLTDANLVKSRYRRLALYHHGFASFLLKEYLTAGKSLNQLAPFADPVFGTHARYLLARVHHADDERAEAAGHYQGVIDQHTQQVKEAREALKNPQALQNDPDEKARLTALANSPPPDHVARSTLFLGVMLYEDGKFSDSLARLTEFQKQFPTSSLIPEVQLRIGFCQVQTRDFPKAIATLQPIADKHPALADQALLWIARAQSNLVGPDKGEEYVKAQKTAIDVLRKAVEKVPGNEPEVKQRRGLILLEMADVQQAGKLYKDAAGTYMQLWNEKLIPTREEEIVQRLATALHLAGDYVESDKVCLRFRDAYPQSPLLPAVLFRHAENAAFAALAAEKRADLPDRVKALALMNDEAIKRYQAVLDKYPEFAHANLARFGVAMGHFRKGDIEKTRDVLENIPVADANGDLAPVPYVLADCLMRLAPTDAEDALAAGKLTATLNKTVELLNAYLTGSAKSAQAPDAYLKLGYCHVRLSELKAQPQDRAQALQSARVAYETMIKTFPQDPLQPQAIFERGRVLALQGDVGGAMNELRRFTQAPLNTSSVAPMAVLRLATMFRGQNQPQNAVPLLAAARQQYEAVLAKDPARAGWVAMLQYHHGLAVKETGKLTEARAIFDGVVKNHAARPEAVESALRLGQCLKEEGKQKIAAARPLLNPAGRTPEQVAAARKQYDEGVKLVTDAVAFLEAQAEALKQKSADNPARARMFYDAAWAARALAAEQIETARQTLQQEQWQKLKEAMAKKTPMGKPVPNVPKPEVALASVPVQESEKKARALYKALIDGFPDLEQNADARFELAELLSDRGEHDPAIALLKEAIDKEPPPELTEKIRLRLGACYVAKNDTKSALVQLQAVARNDKSPLQPHAVYRIGECYLITKEPAEAVKHLARFRDHGPFQNVPGLTDRALLRLGHALAQQQQWDASRQAHELVVNRFPQGAWVHEARYGIGWAHQHKGEFDPAVNAYNQVAAAVLTELGARAQLNVGQCRLAQKRYGDAATAFLVLPYTYDYPELNAVALLEAARALAEDKQREKAILLLERLLKDHPDGEHVEAAKKRLMELKKG